MNTTDDFSDAIGEFLNEDNERAALIFAFSMLEQFISDLLKVKSKHPSSYKNVSTAIKINILNEINAISDGEYEAINWLRHQRNKAAHKAGYKINQKEIRRSWLMPQMKTKSILHNYLATTVLGFWNNHIEIRELYDFANNP